MNTHQAAVPPAPGRAPSGRGRAALAIDWWPRVLPPGTEVNPRTIVTHDGEISRATLYTRGGSREVFCLMHPRQDMRRHPLIPELLEAGYAVWAQASREVGNDLRLSHESVLLDVAAGTEHLRDAGYETVTLIGMSGGAGLYSYYAEQSLRVASDRLATSPDGTRTKFLDAEMPPPDRLILVAPHPGQGRLLLSMIDPSVIDENDPFTADPGLDMYDPQNGFDAGGSGAAYTPEFLERYRKAQQDRVQRIDDRARALIADRLAARSRFKGGSNSLDDQRRGVLSPILTTYRTDADPRCVDLSLDPSDRPYGSVISPRPNISNYGVNGFGRLTTPEAWLSTWSGLSSYASVARSLAGVTVPTLVIEYTGDCSVFPSDVRSALDASAAEDVAHVKVRADHFGRALSPDEESGVPATAAEVVAWSHKRDVR